MYGLTRISRNFAHYTKGTTRKVYIFKNFVIKLPCNSKGILANLREKYISKLNTTYWNRKDLAKVKFCDILGLFLIMEKAERINYNSIDWFDFIEVIEGKYNDDVLRDLMLSDSNITNWGYINKQLAKIDYGNYKIKEVKKMEIICVHYTKELLDCLASDGKCHCDLGLKCPKLFQCPQYETKKDKEE